MICLLSVLHTGAGVALAARRFGWDVASKAPAAAAENDNDFDEIYDDDDEITDTVEPSTTNGLKLYFSVSQASGRGKSRVELEQRLLGFTVL